MLLGRPRGEPPFTDRHRETLGLFLATAVIALENARLYTEAQQARYAVQAYQRLQAEWPWLGVANYWFLKQADEHE